MIPSWLWIPGIMAVTWMIVFGAYLLGAHFRAQAHENEEVLSRMRDLERRNAITRPYVANPQDIRSDVKAIRTPASPTLWYRRN